MNIGDVEKALEGVRKGLRSDGADLVVNAASDECIELSLVVKEDTCLECIVSNDIMLTKVRMVLGKTIPGAPKIVLHDPRI